MRGSSGLCQEELSHWPDRWARTMSLEHTRSCVMSVITASLLAWDVLLPPLTPCHLSPLHLPLPLPSPWSRVSLTLSMEPLGLVRGQYSQTNSIVSKGHEVHLASEEHEVWCQMAWGHAPVPPLTSSVTLGKFMFYVLTHYASVSPKVKWGKQYLHHMLF